MLGCYSFPAHVGVQHPDTPLGIELPTLLDSLRVEFPEADIEYVPGTTIDGGRPPGSPQRWMPQRGQTSSSSPSATGPGFSAAARAVRAATSSRSACPVPSRTFSTPCSATSTPAVVTLLAGRPYALGSAVTERRRDRPGVLRRRGRNRRTRRHPLRSGQSERTVAGQHPGLRGNAAVDLPRRSLARVNGVSSIDPTAAFAFGHGIGYSTFDWTAGHHGPDTVGVDGVATIGLRVRNTGERTGTDIVQVYVHDPVASVVRPVQRLVGFHRVDLAPGESVELSIHLPADVTSFTGR